MKYLRQIIFEMRHQPLVTWLSIAGTAIAIFLIMCDFMIDGIDSASVPPESKGDRIVYGFGGEINTPYGTSSGALALNLAHELYEGLNGVERVAYVSCYAENKNVAPKGGVPENKAVRSVDENYWQIYDYTFLEGKPFSKEEVESGVRDAIISRSLAEKHFGKRASYLGEPLMIDNKLFTVTGVVEDVNPLMDQTVADVYISHVADGLPEKVWFDYLGNYTAILLLKDGVKADDIRRQLEGRYNAFNNRHKDEEKALIYHNQPWTLRETRSGAGSNMTPDTTAKDRTRIITYVILLLIPAINLSSMTRSRMRQRVSEIGLRRAFGCTRWRIVSDLLTENFIITLIGGGIGLLLSVIFLLTFSNYFISYGTFWISNVDVTMARPTFRMLFSWGMFFAILGFCLVLNILSAGIPAIKAAFTNPAEALKGEEAHK